jgi:hypothetical protein
MIERAGGRAKRGPERAGGRAKRGPERAGVSPGAREFK